MKPETLKLFAVATTASLVGMAGGAGLFHAQSAVAQAATMAAPVATAASISSAQNPPTRNPGAAVPGSVQVTRLTDTTFVVVKDEGDAEVVTLFATEGGLVQKKHSGRFFY